MEQERSRARGHAKIDMRLRRAQVRGEMIRAAARFYYAYFGFAYAKSEGGRPRA
jgi:hypothetical protein